MKFQPVKGTRDLYPALYAPIRRIFDAWRSVSIRCGFEEYEGPTLEYLDLYREKSGEELVGQLYTLTDSGGRDLALRPEITPTLARMVAAQVNSLPKPIKWFSIPTLYRGENVQRGRLREFYQWNVDVIGTSDAVADAEVILVGVEALRELGLTEKDFAVHISNRRLIAALLTAAGLGPPQHAAAFALMDKAGKLPREEFHRRWDEAHSKVLPAKVLAELLDAATPQAVQQAAGRWGPPSRELSEAVEETARLLGHLADFGITEFCKLDLRVVRGLAYYTGGVFEFYDRSEKERAICGGGRYDDLLAKVGKSAEPGVGFGMGDVVLSLILQERGLLEARPAAPDVFVIDAVGRLRGPVCRIAAALRRAGLAADFSYAQQPLGKQLKAADKKAARFAVILGDPFAAGGALKVKQMKTGEERDCTEANLPATLKSLLGQPS